MVKPIDGFWPFAPARAAFTVAAAPAEPDGLENATSLIRSNERGRSSESSQPREHGRSAHTQLAYGREVDRFMVFVARPLKAVTLVDVQAFSDSLEQLAPSSRARANRRRTWPHQNPDDSHFPHSVKMNLGRTQLDTTFFLFLSFLE